MGCGNQPALTAIGEGKDELCIKSSGADDASWTHGSYSFEADIMTVPLNSLGYEHFSGPGVQEDYRSYPPDLNCLPDSKTDGVLFNVKSDMSEFCRESEMLYPNVSMRGLCYAIDGNNSVPADCLTNTAVTSSDYGKSEVHMNFTPLRCETDNGYYPIYPIKAHGAEAKNSRLSSYQMSGKFSSSECSTALLPLMDNFGATGIQNDVNIVPFSFSSPQKVDRNFLTLGIGSGTEIRPNSNFSTREIASRLKDVSSQCNNSIVGHCSKNPLNLTQSTGRAARIQTSAGELSSPACNSASRMPTCDEGRLVGDTGFRLSSVPFPGLQTPPINAQSNFSANCSTSVFDSTPLSLPFGSTFISQPKCGTQPEITTSTYFPSQPMSWQQDHCRKSSLKVSSDSSRNYLSQKHKQSPINHVQLGKLIPLTEGKGTQSNTDVRFPESGQLMRNITSTAEDTRTEVAKIGSFPSSVQPVGHLDTYDNASPVEPFGNILCPERTGFQIPKSGTCQSAAAGPFPKRLGLQPNDFATARTTRGPPPINLAADFNPFRPSVSAGQYQHGTPAQSSKDFPRVDYFNGQVIPVAKFGVKPQPSPVISHPSLKRKATENSAAAHSGQRRKTLPQPGKQNSAPGQRKSVTATPAPIPATVHIPPAPLHVKWQGFDGPPEPTGQKCLLCKRDLSFTAEGLVYQPATPPPVAVLPCGHTFHDECLQKITPENQLQSPPCIPCAIGET